MCSSDLFPSHDIGRNWWGSWVRAFGGKFGFAQDGFDVNSNPLKGSLAGLPDFVTEATGTYNIPEFLKNKWAAEDNSTFDNWRIPAAANYRKDGLGAPADYLVKWLSAWVEEFGTLKTSLNNGLSLKSIGFERIKINFHKKIVTHDG